ncbi:MAG: hypothetical protein HZB82_09220 [Deltaproteobacteria bacterium]|nr:hypothetical protein [Deltaproteobacteria bacterium]
MERITIETMCANSKLSQQRGSPQPFERKPRGYVLSAKEFNAIVPLIRVHAGDYKIHEKELTTHRCKEFFNLDDLFENP